MNLQVFKYIVLFVSMILLQVLLCDRIVLFDCAVPIIFFYFILRLPMNFSMNLTLTFSFLLGFFVDVSTDMLGVNSLACTLLAIIRKPIYYLYVPKDDKSKDNIPSLRSIGPTAYCKYLLTLTALYCFMIFGLDFFSVLEIYNILKMTVASTILSFPILLCIDSIIPEHVSQR